MDARGDAIQDDSFLMLFNAHFEPIDFTIPNLWGDNWTVVLETAEPRPPSADAARRAKAGEAFAVEARALTVLQRDR
jgi:glycogen operon protein